MDRYGLIRIGGVKKCCFDTLAEKYFYSFPENGDMLHCGQCSVLLMYTNKAWQWMEIGFKLSGSIV